MGEGANEEKTGGLWDRQENHWLVFEIDGTRQAARQHVLLPSTPDLPPAQRRLAWMRGIGMIGVARMGAAPFGNCIPRPKLARLAVIEERSRLSRDLHDLLGQTLSVITLKSELARGLLQEEPASCAQELADIERVSRLRRC